MSRFYPRDPEVRFKQRAFLRRRLAFFFALFLVAVVILTYAVLRWSGNWLVLDATWDRADWVVVLDGQTASMERSDEALRLLKTAKVDSILVLGRRAYRDRSNADFYVEDMLLQGRIDTSRLFLFRHDDPSSIEEALTVIPLFQARQVDTVIVLTQNAATRRVSHIFQKLSGGKPVFVVASSKDPAYDPATWLHSREARKIWLREWTAYFVAKWELWGVEPIQSDPRKVKSMEPVAAGVLPSPPMIPLEILLSSSSASNDSTNASILQESSQSASSEAVSSSEKAKSSSSSKEKAQPQSKGDLKSKSSSSSKKKAESSSKKKASASTKKSSSSTKKSSSSRKTK